MSRIVDETIEALTPHVLGVDELEGFPPAKPADTLDFTRSLREKIFPELRLFGTLLYLVFNLYSMLVKGHTFPRLGYQEQSELVEPVLSSRNKIIAIVVRLLSYPYFSAYYSRPDVQKMLGFDIVALKEESKLRSVSREGGPLPPKTPEAGPEGERPDESTGNLSPLPPDDQPGEAP